MRILKELNNEQRSAVEMTGGPIMIVAGPGTGKTKTLVGKIAYLILEKKVDPESILALTFTKKAANEMRERLAGITGDGQPLPFIGTFHSLGHWILSDYDKLHPDDSAGLAIIKEDDRQLLLKDLKKALADDPEFCSLSVKDLSLKISLAKNSASDQNNLPTGIDKLVEMYNKKLAEKNAIDYDDLISRNYQLLVGNHALRQAYRHRYNYILIDEFQDTSPLQYALVKLLTNEKKNIFVIGDPLQAIYSFRGASDASFRKFRQDFPDCKQIELRTNYRSSQNIIDASRMLFPQAPSLIAHGRSVGEISQVSTYNPNTEAEWIIRRISEKMGGIDLNQTADPQLSQDDNARFSDFAVIYRTHSVGRILKNVFRQSLIPYQTVGNESLFESKPVKAIIDIIKKIDCADSSGFLPIGLDDIADEHHQGGLPLSSLVEKIIDWLHLRQQYAGRSELLADLQEFCNFIFMYDSAAEGIKHFLQYVDKLGQNEFYDYQADKVTLLTIHAAKGLEFKYVFIAGCEEGLIPYKKSIGPTAIEEEKRLFYVALTRAKQGVALTSVKKRPPDGPALPSRFLEMLKGGQTIEEVDPVWQKIEKKAAKKRDEERQLRLF